MELIINETTWPILKLAVMIIVACYLCFSIGLFAGRPSKEEKQAYKRIRALEERVGMDADMFAAAKRMMEDATLRSAQSGQQSPPQNLF